MSKLDILNEGREQGIHFAYKIVKSAQAEGKDPKKALDRELSFRKRTSIRTLLTQKEITETNERFLDNAINACAVLAMATLWDVFGFGKVRNARFMDAYSRNTEAFFEGNLTWEDLLKLLDEKCDMKIDLSDDLAARR